MNFLRRLNYILYKFQKRFILFIFGGLIIFSFVQVVLRLFFKSGIENADTFIRYLVLWVGFLGASLATYKNRHINIDIITQFFKKINRRIVSGIINGAAFIIAFFLLIASVTFISYELADTTRVFFIPKISSITKKFQPRNSILGSGRLPGYRKSDSL